MPSWCLRLGNVCSRAVIRGIVHHIDTGLIQVGDKPLLNPSSEVVAVYLTVVVTCTGCCFIRQKNSRDETMSASIRCHNYPLALIHLSKLSLACCPLPEFLGGVGSVNTGLIFVNKFVSQVLQLSFPLVDSQAQRHNVLSLYNTFPCPLPPVPKLMHHLSKTSRKFMSSVNAW